jgi:hypothetical protein
MDWEKYKRDFFYREVRPLWFFILELCILIVVLALAIRAWTYWIPEEVLYKKCYNICWQIVPKMP